MSWSYEEYQKQTEADCRKLEARLRAARAKKEERRQIKKQGGGKAIAKAILKPDDNWDSDTDFPHGANSGTNSPTRTEDNGFDSPGCMGPVKCVSCGKFHGYCRELDEDKEKMKMLPSGSESAQQRNRKSTSGITWLNVQDLSATPKEAKILAVNYNKNGRFGARVELKLAIDGQIKYWGVPPLKDGKSPNYELLTSRFGLEENEWIDQRILLYAEPHKFYDGQFFVRVDFPKAGKK